MENEGSIQSGDEENLLRYETGIRGSFSQYKGIKQRDTSLFSSTALIRTLLFLAMIIVAFGYIYIGPEIFMYFLYVGLIASAIYFIFKLKNRAKDE